MHPIDLRVRLASGPDILDASFLIRTLKLSSIGPEQKFELGTALERLLLLLLAWADISMLLSQVDNVQCHTHTPSGFIAHECKSGRSSSNRMAITSRDPQALTYTDY